MKLITYFIRFINQLIGFPYIAYYCKLIYDKKNGK